MEKITKKGQSNRDFMTVMLVIFGFGVFIIILSLISINIITNFMAEFPLNADVQEAGQKFIDSYRIFDKMFVFIMVSMIIAIGITSYKIATNKVFFVISFIMAGIYGFIAYFFSYIFGQIVSDPVLSSITLLFPNTIMICTNLHWISLALVVVSTITLYAKRDRDFNALT